MKFFPKTPSIGAALGLAVLGVAAMTVAACGPDPRAATSTEAPAARIGGPFALTDASGRRVDQNILHGKWTMIFFGYTSCPDVCPTTLTALGQVMVLLGDKAARTQVVFVTVDPARDTPARLKLYLTAASFPKGTVGLTGSPADIAAVARAYRVYYKKVPDGATYSMDHTAVIYLMDAQGRFADPINPSQTPRQMADQIVKAMADR